MDGGFSILVFVAGFFIIALASKQMGQYFKKATMPLISGFLFTGIIAGPYVLNLISIEAVEKLGFIDELSLSFIAFAAGGELFMDDLKDRLRSIKWITIGLVISTFTIGSIAVFLLTDLIPFMRNMPVAGRVGVSILAGSILVARSPSSAIAVVKELRAKGPFTQTVLGVTVIMDVAVIILFTANTSIAAALFSGLGIDISFIAILFLELVLSVALGFILGEILKLILSSRTFSSVKAGLILTSGYGIYVITGVTRKLSGDLLPFEILVEPLLICMMGGFLVTNYSKYRMEFSKILHDLGPPIYIAFFTLTGASLSLNVLVNTWQIALVLFFVRCGSIFIGSFTGGIIAGEPMNFNKISWMSYITQAGVGLGLAKSVVVVFPEWGTSFATIMVAIIVLNQIIGPPMFKRSINLAGETHSHAESSGFEIPRTAIIFGLEGQSQALAQLLFSHGWKVKIACLNANENDIQSSDIQICPVKEYSLEVLRDLGLDQAESIVTMLSDKENYNICELAYENFGTENIVVRLNDRLNFEKFHELGALIVNPITALVSLLDHFVRSPSATSLLLGMEKDQDVIEVEVRNPDLDGVALRDLKLPVDAIILSIKRRGQNIISHGYSRLEKGDWVTICGSLSSLEEVDLRFDINKEYALVHMVEQVAAKEVSPSILEKDVKKIILEKVPVSDKLNQFISDSLVLDIDLAIDVETFDSVVAETMAAEIGIDQEILLKLLIEREKKGSTALSRGLAIPHVIIEGENKSYLLMARCKEGIMFSDSAPKVHAVFVLVGTRDQRKFHLKALSYIVKIIQGSNFENKWLRARNEQGLKNVILTAFRKRTV